MSNDSEWNSFADLSRISNEDIMEENEEDVEESLTHKLTSRFDRAIRMPNSSLCALVKSTIFIVGNSNFELCISNATF